MNQKCLRDKGAKCRNEWVILMWRKVNHSGLWIFAVESELYLTIDKERGNHFSSSFSVWISPTHRPSIDTKITWHTKEIQCREMFKIQEEQVGKRISRVSWKYLKLQDKEIKVLQACFYFLRIGFHYKKSHGHLNKVLRHWHDES